MLKLTFFKIILKVKNKKRFCSTWLLSWELNLNLDENFFSLILLHCYFAVLNKYMGFFCCCNNESRDFCIPWRAAWYRKTDVPTLILSAIVTKSRPTGKAVSFSCHFLFSFTSCFPFSLYSFISLSCVCLICKIRMKELFVGRL